VKPSRLIVASLTAGYVYCAHGETENRCKECHIDLFADRISTDHGDRPA